MMVLEKQVNGKTAHMCEICKFSYEDKEWAQKCEDFCKEKGMCSMDITEHAIERQK